MDSEPWQEFAKLVPINFSARKLFSRAAKCVRDHPDGFHLGFYQVEQITSELSHTTIDSDTDGTGTDIEGSMSSPSAQTNEDKGHFVLSLGQDVDVRLLRGWRAGKGTKTKQCIDVDLLLASPRDPKRSSLARVGFSFRFNPQSGMLMLVAEDMRRPVSYFVKGKWVELRHPAELVLFKQEDIIRVDDHEYILIFTLPSEIKEEYFKARERWCVDILGYAMPPPKLWPGSINLLGDNLTGNTIGSGAFGWISSGIRWSTGEPIAIKEVKITQTTDQASVRDEGNLGLSLQVTVLLTKTCIH